jgi:regulator of cell morphogenesis and NO signaling
MTSDMKMAELIHYNYLLIPVIRRFGIKLGFGEKTIGLICREQNIDPDFFLTIVNTFSNKDYFPQKRLQKFNIILFIEYLKKTHSYYLETQVPVIESNIDNLISSSPVDSLNLQLVRKFFHSYKKELTEHLHREEAKTFPYIEHLYRLYTKEFDIEDYKQLVHTYSMHKFIEEHDNIDDKIFDLQSILIKYMSGTYSENMTQTVLFELFRLENDIKNHTRLEEKILRPMVEDIEQTLKSYTL